MRGIENHHQNKTKLGWIVIIRLLGTCSKLRGELPQIVLKIQKLDKKPLEKDATSNPERGLDTQVQIALTPV